MSPAVCRPWLDRRSRSPSQKRAMSRISSRRVPCSGGLSPEIATSSCAKESTRFVVMSAGKSRSRSKKTGWDLSASFRALRKAIPTAARSWRTSSGAAMVTTDWRFVDLDFAKLRPLTVWNSCFSIAIVLTVLLSSEDASFIPIDARGQCYLDLNYDNLR